MSQEKSETARIKSRMNVYMSQTTSEKQNQLKDLQQKEELLDKKLRNISYRQQYEHEISHIKHTPETSKSPIQKNFSIYSHSPITDHDVVKAIPKPLPPPTLSYLADEVKRRSVSPERKLLGTYDTKEIVSQLIIKNYEEASKQALLILKDTETPSKPKSSYAEITELLSSGKIPMNRETPKKHSLYNQLLKKKYGVIEPRIFK
jgi:hypothetical protein